MTGDELVTWVIQYQEVHDNLLLHAAIGPVVKSDEPEYFQHLAVHSLHGTETGGCALSFDPKLRRAVIWLNRKASDIDEIEFERLVTAFMDISAEQDAALYEATAAFEQQTHDTNNPSEMPGQSYIRV